VDDALMGITHVIRGDDHLNNTPRQVPIFQALGYPIPRFGHLSMIMGPDGKKLSKRHGAVSILDYRDKGFLPEAMVNYLVRLGWSFGDQEIFSVAELIEKFSLDTIQKSAAVFNPEKLLWVNAQYLKSHEPKRIAELLLPFLERAGFGETVRKMPDGWVERFVLALRERSQTLVEMAAAAGTYLQEDVEVEAAAAGKFLTPGIVPSLEKLTDRVAKADFTIPSLERVFKLVLEEEGLKMGQLAQPVRVALTGRTASPGLFEVMEVLGRERTLFRIREGIERASA
jgi:glutamyl-tRNA synthetase